MWPHQTYHIIHDLSGTELKYYETAIWWYKTRKFSQILTDHMFIMQQVDETINGNLKV